MGAESRTVIDTRWREGFLLGLLWIVGGLIGGAALGVVTGEPMFYLGGFVFGVVAVFLLTSYYKYGR